MLCSEQVDFVNVTQGAILGRNSAKPGTFEYRKREKQGEAVADGPN